ncbi:MAG: hypothetical protein UR60_C0004G0003 [Candidatus Moranbacteria bacterium GW2011_GWF2_34_56]|nr:MAG: hypothetical protein UR51_C0010G0070 [Candidatus Moranbacteria bacterium GW2011_GWF1_34_10]KKP65274.1 MAG: hypothetical protein UR60_C0004G0003 [Candidatus Moranbacteria bacterium GW2011_GWF2_34_56]HBI16881.1 hypothetical protein [Candidatus Moranbacteria bacterium]
MDGRFSGNTQFVGENIQFNWEKGGEKRRLKMMACIDDDNSGKEILLMLFEENSLVGTCRAKTSDNEGNRSCNLCNHNLEIRNLSSVTVINYLPEDKIVVLRLFGRCPECSVDKVNILLCRDIDISSFNQ